MNVGGLKWTKIKELEKANIYAKNSIADKFNSINFQGNSCNIYFAFY